MKPIVAYVRVSTSQQGRSGLGIEAQRECLVRFAGDDGSKIVAEFVEVETGKGSDALDRRPKSAEALAKARALRCPVAVAKLDRLSRDVHLFLASWRIACRSLSSTSGRTSIRSSCTSTPRSPKRSAP
jgi:DNA invertase Pin-like site-specific DNA recombinase